MCSPDRGGLPVQFWVLQKSGERGGQIKTIAQAAREEEAAIAAEGDVSKEEVFYLKDLNGFIAVYKSDKKTIYEYTNIVVEDLPEDVRQEILDGKEIRTVEKLYGFLENYSS